MLRQVIWMEELSKVKVVMMWEEERIRRLLYSILIDKILVIFDDSDLNIKNIRKKFERIMIQRNLMNRYVIYGRKDKDYEFMISLYNTYEFTNQMRVVSNSVQYGTMLNYIKTGVITEEEYLETLFL